MKLKYKRILIKLSGKSLVGSIGHGIDFDRVLEICSYVKDICDLGVEVAIIVGVGNFGVEGIRQFKLM